MDSAVEQLLNNPLHLELLAKQSQRLRVAPQRFLTEMERLQCASAILTNGGPSGSSPIDEGKLWRERLAAVVSKLEEELAPSGASPATEESAYDAFKRAGLIGCIKDGPSDLSTNPKYMEGFGE